MLRWVIGDENFFAALKNYISDPELIYGYAKTPDLQRHLETESGMDLDEFFSDWVYGKGFPTYSLDWGYDENSKLFVRIYQSQSDESVEYFEMPVPIQLKGEGKDTIVVLDNWYNEQYYNLNVDFKVNSVSFDPDQWLCAKSQDINYLSTDQLSNKVITVYPNPFLNEVKFVVNGDDEAQVQVKIYDVTGRIVAKINGNHQSEIIWRGENLKGNPVKNGIYVYKIVSDDSIITGKILKY
ncbi:MAG TPA: T9SS type A sorting domain-containing protein [Bacteroidetes bacterium]|nr:T9SS type A sorting domain-containing protein [Bacteroidota bacterium]